MEDKLLKDIALLRERYTLRDDKDLMTGWAKQVRLDLLKANLADKQPIKDLLIGLEKRIDDITYLLGWDEKMNENERSRDKLFALRESYQFLTSFFTDAKRNLKSIKNKVNLEIND